MAEQQEKDQTAKRKSRSDLFLIIGILSILIGFLVFSFLGSEVLL